MDDYDIVSHIYAYNMIFENYFCEFLVTVYEDFQRRGDHHTICDSGYYGADFSGISIKSCFQDDISATINNTYEIIKSLNLHYETRANRYIDNVVDKTPINREIYNHLQNFYTCHKSQRNKLLKIASNYQVECHNKYNYLTELAKKYLSHANEKNKMFLDTIYESSFIDCLSDPEYDYLCDTYSKNDTFETYYYQWMSKKWIIFCGKNKE